MFVWTIVVGSIGNTLFGQGITRLCYKAQTSMKLNRSFVDGSRNTFNGLNALFFYRIKEGFIQLPAYVLSPAFGVYTNKMNVGFLWIGLRDKTRNKTQKLVGGAQRKTGFGKMFKKQPGQHVRHISATPPGIELGNNSGIVRCGEICQRSLHIQNL